MVGSGLIFRRLLGISAFFVSVTFTDRGNVAAPAAVVVFVVVVVLVNALSIFK